MCRLCGVGRVLSTLGRILRKVTNNFVADLGEGYGATDGQDRDGDGDKERKKDRQKERKKERQKERDKERETERQRQRNYKQ